MRSEIDHQTRKGLMSKGKRMLRKGYRRVIECTECKNEKKKALGWKRTSR